MVDRVDLHKTQCDLTEYRQLEEALHQSEERFRWLYEASFEGLAVHERGVIVEANQALATMFGYELSEMIGKSVLDFAAAESRDIVRGNILAGNEMPYEATGLRKDGSTFPVELVGKRSFYQGRIARVSALRDITERKRAEDALREDAARFATIIQTQRDITAANRSLDELLHLIADRSQDITRASGAVVELAEGDEMVYRVASGTAAAQVGLRLKIDASLSGLCVRTGEVLRCDDSETDPRVDRAACRQVGLRSMVVVPLHHEQSIIGVLKVLSPKVRAFGDQDIRIMQMMAGTISASIQRKQAEEELRDSEERLRLALDSARMVTWDWDIPADSVIWDGNHEQLFGSTDEAAEGSLGAFLERVHPADRDFVGRSIARDVEQCLEHKIEFRVMWPDGTVRWLEGSGSVLRDDEGRAVRMVGIGIDITERRRAEQEIRRLATRLITAQEDERRRFSRELHDDVGQALAAFDMRLHMLERSLAGTESSAPFVGGGFAELKQIAYSMQESVRRMTRALHPPVLEHFGLVKALCGYLQEVSEETKIGYSIHAPDNFPRLAGTKESVIYRIVQEAVSNVLKHARATSISLGYTAEGSAATIKVADDGCGFNVAGAGSDGRTGLVGMRERAEMIGAKLHIESIIGEGTLVSIRIRLDN